MTENEAINRLVDHFRIHNDGRPTPYLDEAVSMAINSLKKQIPKKPNKAIDSSWGIKKEVHVCPVCDYYLTEVYFLEIGKTEEKKKITYCETCGQAIDWSE